GESVLDLGVEGRQLLDEFVGIGLEHLGLLGAQFAQLVGEGLDHGDEARGVEPEVRVGLALAFAFAFVVVAFSGVVLALFVGVVFAFVLVVFVGVIFIAVVVTVALGEREVEVDEV